MVSVKYKFFFNFCSGGSSQFWSCKRLSELPLVFRLVFRPLFGLNHCFILKIYYEHKQTFYRLRRHFKPAFSCQVPLWTTSINHFVFAFSGRACQLFSFCLKPEPLILDVDRKTRITTNSRDFKLFVVQNSIGSPFRMQDQLADPSSGVFSRNSPFSTVLNDLS